MPEAVVVGPYDREVAASYDAGQADLGRQLHNHVTWATLRPLLPPPGGRVLDAGAGTGLHAVPLLEAGYRVTLLDPSRAMLDVARRKATEAGRVAQAEFLVGSLATMGLAAGRFDLVLSEGDPLSYCIGREAEAAREVLRVLRPGGAFYVGVDNRWLATLAFLAQGDAGRARAAAVEGRSVDPYGAPVHAFGPNELRALFEAAGARGVRVGGNGVFHHFLPPDHLARVLQDNATRAWYLDLEARAATDPHFAGLAAHLHVSGRRGDSP